MMPRNNSSNKKPPIAMPINSTVYQDSFDLRSHSFDFSEQERRLAMSRYTMSASGRRPDSKFAQPSRSFAERALPPLPPTSIADSAASLQRPYVDLSVEDDVENPRIYERRGQNLALTHPDMAEAFATSPRSSDAELVYQLPRVNTFKMQKLEQAMDDDWTDEENRKEVWRDRCCWILVTTMVIVFLLAIVSAALYFAMKPKPIVADVQNMRLTSFKLLENGGAPSTTAVQAGINFTLRIHNPNKFAAAINEKVSGAFHFRKSILGTLSVPQFKQSPQSETALSVEVPKTVSQIEERLDALDFVHEVTDASVRMELSGASEGHYKIWGLKVKSFMVPFHCVLSVKPESAGNPSAINYSSCYKVM